MLILALVPTALFMLIKTDGSLDRLRSKGVIRIGFAVEAPYAFLDKNGLPTGESPEVAKKIVHSLGIQRIQWRLTAFSSLIPELEAGRIDVIAAGMFITRDRAQTIAFSEPTFKVFPSLLVASMNPWNLTSDRAIVSQPNIIIATVRGSVEEKHLLKLGLEDRRILHVPDGLTGKVAVESGLAHGLLLSRPALRWVVSQDKSGQIEIVPGYSASKSPEDLGYGGFGFRQSDKQLLAAWNEQLQKYVGSEQHMNDIKFFGFEPDNQPGNITTKEILAR